MKDRAVALVGRWPLDIQGPIEEGESGIGRLWWRCRGGSWRKNSRGEAIWCYELEVIRFDPKER